jgi:pimeloyl-ACP methyl ester carboxylesterase
MPNAKPHPTDVGPIALADHGWFYAGGDYVECDGSPLLRGAMYVERFVPEKATQPYPVVMIHGNGQTGTNFTGTPDGRRGWAHDFLRAGYTVYVVDQPVRGRSGQSHALYGASERRPGGLRGVETRFTAPETANLWPQAKRHTQWPGSGQKGDPAFDQFFASQVESLADGDESERLNQQAGAALLDRIGPAIVMVHSQSGAFGWLIADARPKRVKAILSIEPNGPPFFDVELKGAPDWFAFAKKPARNWGIARIPLTYDPPAETPGALEWKLADAAPSKEHVRCYLQAEPARRLTNLAGIPILILTGEASYHAAYDHATSAFLTQAGVENDFVRLEDIGQPGNGHMIMCERNNHEVADYLIGWLARRLR